MDRASDSGSEGWGFESRPAYQKRRGYGLSFFWYPKGLELFDANVRWTFACRRSRRRQHLTMFPPGTSATSPFRRILHTPMNTVPQNMRSYGNKDAYFNIMRFHRKQRTIPQSSDNRGNRRTVPLNDGQSRRAAVQQTLFLLEK